MAGIWGFFRASLEASGSADLGVESSSVSEHRLSPASHIPEDTSLLGKAGLLQHAAEFTVGLVPTCHAHHC